MVPALVYLGFPEALSLGIFLFPILIALTRINKFLEIVPVWALFLYLTSIVISAVNSHIAFANILIFSSLVLQFPLGFLLLRNLSNKAYFELVKHLNYVCIIQMLTALVQIFIWVRPGDSVNGTMLGDFHGTHIMPFMLFTTILLDWKLGLISTKNLIYPIILSSFIAFKSDAKLVLLAVVLYICLISFCRILTAGENFGRKLTSLFILLVLCIFLVGSNVVTSVQTRWSYELSRAFQSKTLILEEYFDPLSDFSLQTSILVGAGPTQTVSRSAIIAQRTSSVNSKSPLEPTTPRFYASFTQTTGKFNIGPISSISQPISSIVGILGDIGILGSIALFVLLSWPIKNLLRRQIHILEISSLFLVFLMPLSYFNTFLEFPQAVFPFVIALVGLSIPGMAKGPTN